ncbi:hypothetical protein QN372_07085 [Undibacterium sp. RTI2.1]|uniref:hypothetical protein n=1 Tax=unclassified Undibacterium TaxID=2630295 RepID=UPI002B234F7E|nr:MULTISPECIES: hypothetical protein [unclassified Undibacterium]MEB0030501.1 hypothetical protein [Undibacterium sp. RTI2.1]MEB0116999.1 hypothetical protein [Undibacterium sp. RTI2.2]
MSRIKRLLRPEVQPINWKAAMSVVTLSAVCLSVYAHSASHANPQADPNTSGVVKSNAAKQASSASTHKITDTIIDLTSVIQNIQVTPWQRVRKVAYICPY